MTNNLSWAKALCFAFSLMLGLNVSAQLTDAQLAQKIANKEQLTDVPTIYIDIPTITDETSLGQVLYKIRKGNADDEEIAPYSDATITVVDNSEVGSVQHLTSFTDAVQIKVRGNSTASAGNGKLPYRLKFASKKTAPDGVAHKHDLLGMGYSKRNWTLIANNFDRSLIRNAVTFHLGQYIGMEFCPGYKFVDLVISGLYRGSYMVSDHCEVGSNRIDIDEDNDWYMEFECWGQMAEAPYIGQGDGDDHYVSIKNPDADDLTAEQIEQLKADVLAWRKEWISSFNNGSWQKYNDVESFIKFYIANEITGDLDGYFVFKGYKKSTDNLLHWGPLWDKDLAYGNTTYANEELSAFYGKTNFEWVFKNNLFKDKSFLKAVDEKLDALIADGLYDKLSADIDRIVASMEGSRLQNYAKWDITAGSMGSEVYTMADYSEHITVLKDYINNRISYLQTEIQGYLDQLPKPTAATYDPTLDGFNGDIPTVGYGYNLTVLNRTLVGGKWNVICLPCDATQEQLEAALGCTYELAAHTGMDSDGTTMLFTVLTDKKMTCGVPYFIKPAQNVSSFKALDDVVYAANLQYGQYNGDAVTFDGGVHAFNAQIYKKNVLQTNHYIFENDVYDEGVTAVTPPGTPAWDGVPVLGARAYFTVTTGEVPVIKFVTPEGGGDIVTPVTRTQLTDVPTIYIDTENGADVQSSTGDYVQAVIQVIDANGTLDPFQETNYQDLQIRGKGVTEWNNHDKKSYRLKFEKKKKSSDGQEHKHDLTGAGYVKRNWVLLGSADDESLLRHALTNTVGTQLDMAFTPNYCFVDLVLNDEYQGTYIATDFIEIDSNRVIAEDADEDNDWLLELTNAPSSDSNDLAIDGDDSKPYVIIKNPEASSKTGTEDEIKNNVQTFFDALWADNSNTYYDVSSFAKWYVAVELLGGYYSLSDVYAYKSPAGEKLSFGPLWGSETAYNNVASQDMLSLMNDLNDDASFKGMVFNSGDASPWKAKLSDLWQEDWFKTAVAQEWDNVKASIQSTLTNQLTTLADAVAQSQAKNYTDLSGTDYTLSSTYEAAVAKIRTYIEARVPYLTKKFALLADNTVLRGDADGNGKVENADAVAVLRHLVGNTPSNFNETNADANGDGTIDNADAVAILRLILSETSN